ncbi:e3 ubiquitin-protein ligase xiap [Anaeramoeba flamelloides]|uniref:E3 ubiquitin-protein ligase xiap n=1 Tax=Anaeramoeba flamelloides TaxID=1746091 RepID=A0AAV7YAW5_9EUKA|nr:e3 ubiquitin-protein ligase xiap [Anaeramoeba flamelloides]
MSIYGLYCEATKDYYDQNTPSFSFYKGDLFRVIETNAQGRVLYVINSRSKKQPILSNFTTFIQIKQYCSALNDFNCNDPGYLKFQKQQEIEILSIRLEYLIGAIGNQIGMVSFQNISAVYPKRCPFEKETYPFSKIEIISKDLYHNIRTKKMKMGIQKESVKPLFIYNTKKSSEVLFFKSYETQQEQKSDLINSSLDKIAIPHCSYCGCTSQESIVQCVSTRRWFCNGKGDTKSSHIVRHLTKSRKKEISLHPKGLLGNLPIQCHSCGSKNIWKLGLLQNIEKSSPVFLCNDPCLKNKSFNSNSWEPLIQNGCLLSFIVPPPSNDELKNTRIINKNEMDRLEETWAKDEFNKDLVLNFNQNEIKNEKLLFKLNTNKNINKNKGNEDEEEGENSNNFKKWFTESQSLSNFEEIFLNYFNETNTLYDQKEIGTNLLQSERTNQTEILQYKEYYQNIGNENFQQQQVQQEQEQEQMLQQEHDLQYQQSNTYQSQNLYDYEAIEPITQNTNLNTYEQNLSYNQISNSNYLQREEVNTQDYDENNYEKFELNPYQEYSTNTFNNNVNNSYQFEYENQFHNYTDYPPQNNQDNIHTLEENEKNHNIYENGEYYNDIYITITNKLINKKYIQIDHSNSKGQQQIENDNILFTIKDLKLQVNNPIKHQQEKNQKLNKTKKKKIPKSKKILCKICMINSANSLFLPCKHMLCCENCTKIIFEKNKKCPLCRTEIKKTMKIFIA